MARRRHSLGSSAMRGFNPGMRAGDPGMACFGPAPFLLYLWDLSQKHHGPTTKLMKLAPGTELAVFPDLLDWSPGAFPHSAWASPFVGYHCNSAALRSLRW